MPKAGIHPGPEKQAAGVLPLEPYARLFRYNWAMRRLWFNWLADRPAELATRQFTGGLHSFVNNFTHAIGAETRWVRSMQGQPRPADDFAPYQSLEAVRRLEAERRPITEAFLAELRPADLERSFDFKGTRVTWATALLQVATHEVHHVGQMYVWAREAGEAPPPASLFSLELG